MAQALPMTEAESKDRFRHISVWLNQTAYLWQPRPFVGLPVSWEEQHREIALALRGLTLDQADYFGENPEQLIDKLPAIEWLVKTNRDLSLWPDLEKSPSLSQQQAAAVNVPFRKWQQIHAFTRTLLAHQPNEIQGWIDWCSGKGHLGRLLALTTGSKGLCIEKDAQLCCKGMFLANRQGADVRFLNLDVLHDDPGLAMEPAWGIAALHACGRLNLRLLRLIVKHRVSYLALAPCCYHRIDSDTFIPLSKRGQATGLLLSRNHLRFVALAEVVVSKQQRDRRRREQAYRLAFDLLVREASGQDSYHPLGQIPARWLAGPFEKFARAVAREHNFPLPNNWNPQSAEAAGWDRLVVVNALGIVRGLFRRTLESWLILDRNFFLQENEYQTTVGRFCDRQITPRNLMIIAERK